MAGSLSDAAEVDILKGLVGATASIVPATSVYLALIVSGASDSSAGTECTGTDYARVQIDSAMGTPSAGAVTNTSAIEFPAAGHASNWGTLTQVAAFDASTSGNFLWWADLSASKTPGLGDVVRIPIGELDITLT